MTQMLVLALDDQLRGILRGILRDILRDILSATGSCAEGVAVKMDSDGPAYLAAHVQSMLLLSSRRDADEPRTIAFIAPSGAGAHADHSMEHLYLLLSTNPQAMSQEAQAHLAQRGIAFQPTPIHLDALLARVHEVAERLALSPVPVPVPAPTHTAAVPNKARTSDGAS